MACKLYPVPGLDLGDHAPADPGKDDAALLSSMDGALSRCRIHCEAPEDDVLRLWEGLGYYARASNIAKAARIMVSEYGGEFRVILIAAKMPGSAATRRGRSWFRLQW